MNHNGVYNLQLEITFKGKITCEPYTCGLNGEFSRYMLLLFWSEMSARKFVTYQYISFTVCATYLHLSSSLWDYYTSEISSNLFILIRCVVSIKLPDHHRGQWAASSPCGSEWVYSAAACHQSTSRDSNAPRGLAARMHHWQTEPCPLHSWTKQLTGLPEGPACRSVGEEHTDLQNVRKIPPKPIWAFRWTKINKSKAHRKQKQSIHPQLSKYSSRQSNPVKTTS